ncbi:type VI secretion protein [Arenicella chitinivorans]|uniref:Type VI secretion protein n=1 Tax=Arenicella chitinivorans TaxID=1329800 RepID=A0A918VR38_9GAMM|nr:DUF4150 domain-containing protein [Arenicella chitinivorans]GHA21032.1 type VI secretion protein [Arenicella chitinivorans]
MFQNTFFPAIHFAFPDVCNTPTPAGPVPIPYPNIALTSTSIPTVFNQFIQAMPIHNLMTMAYISNGDNPGVLGGVASGMVMGPERHILGSFKVFATAFPVVKMLMPTEQNGPMGNMVGATLSPSQLKVMVLT